MSRKNCSIKIKNKIFDLMLGKKNEIYNLTVYFGSEEELNPTTKIE